VAIQDPSTKCQSNKNVFETEALLALAKEQGDQMIFLKKSPKM
jgi:hypothetical protein